jgi:hypothetical protein
MTRVVCFTARDGGPPVMAGEVVDAVPNSANGSAATAVRLLAVIGLLLGA